MGRAAPLRTVADYVRWTQRRLVLARLHFGHGVDNARDEAAWLVGGALKLAPSDLEAQWQRTLSVAERRAVRDLIAARIRTRKPTAYLLRHTWFAGHSFYVDERALIPRSLLAEFVRERFQPWITPARVRHVLDLCTGSGCIAIAVAHAFPKARVDAADISEDALGVARINVAQHGLGGRVRLIRSDLFTALRGRRYDVIVTNPPYVDRATMRQLPPEYRHEPAIGLLAGESGLEVIARILADAHAHLTPGGILIAETGNSSTALQARFPRVPFVWLNTERGDESVFLLTAEQLAEHCRTFDQALRGKPRDQIISARHKSSR